MAKHLLQKPFAHVALRRHGPTPVVLTFAIGDDPHHTVDNHIARPGVEGDDFTPGP